MIVCTVCLLKVAENREVLEMFEELHKEVGSVRGDMQPLKDEVKSLQP
jgi:hypothetical protein